MGKSNKEKINENISSASHWEKIFMEEFSKESDRACVILAVAMIDQAIETLLKTYLVPSSTTVDNLFEDAYAPISTFNAKIILANRVGLISSQFCRDLNLVRKIRNEFAHNVKGCTFDNETVRNRIVELRHSLASVKSIPSLRENFPSGIKGDFQMSASWLLYHLWDLVEKIKPLKEAEKEWVYKNYELKDGKLIEVNV